MEFARAPIESADIRRFILNTFVQEKDKWEEDIPKLSIPGGLVASQQLMKEKIFFRFLITFFIESKIYVFVHMPLFCQVT